MSNNQTQNPTQKPYKFSFPDPWEDNAPSEPAAVSEPEPPWELPPGPVLAEPPRREIQPLSVVSGEDLADMRLEPIRFCVEDLLPVGLSFLGGSPKAGKSWLVLDLCVRVARGQALWEIPTAQGDVLYLSLEDSFNRLQNRLNRVTEDPPENLFFSISAGTIADGLLDQIRNFQQLHPKLSLVAVDTFQLIRNNREISYAGDYEEVRQLKALAEELQIALLLVHHLRKKKDKDPLNRLSGTNGISGAADAVFVLDRQIVHIDDLLRGQDLIVLEGLAVLGVEGTLERVAQPGADALFEDRLLRLQFDRGSCCWTCLSDSLGHPEKKLPSELEQFVFFMRGEGTFSGTNTELANLYNSFAKTSFSPKALKQQLNRWRYVLEECGVYFKSFRSNGTRLVSVEYRKPADSDGSAVKDAENAAGEICVLSVPCDPLPAP